MRASNTRTRVTATSAASHGHVVRRARAKATPAAASRTAAIQRRQQIAGRGIVGPQLQDRQLDRRAAEQPEGRDGAKCDAARQKRPAATSVQNAHEPIDTGSTFQSPVPKT